MADKYQLMFLGDDEILGPVVELTNDELKVVEKLFGGKPMLSGLYDSIILRNISAEERAIDERKKRAERERLARVEAYNNVRNRYIVNPENYGGSKTAMAAAFAKASLAKSK